MPDHVPLVTQCDPQFGIHRAIEHLKGYTLKGLREEFPHLKLRIPSRWTNAYYVATLGTGSFE